MSRKYCKTAVEDNTLSKISTAQEIKALNLYNNNNENKDRRRLHKKILELRQLIFLIYSLLND